MNLACAPGGPAAGASCIGAGVLAPRRVAGASARGTGTCAWEAMNHDDGSRGGAAKAWPPG
jgi:hypothetical protein